MKGGKVFLSICLLWWGMVLVFFFDMISGLGIILLKLFILSYSCSANNKTCISEVLIPLVGDDDRVWSLIFYREFNDWELVASYSLLHFIQTWIPRGGGSDRLCWRLNGSGKFDVRSLWMYMLRLFGIDWVMHGSVADLLFRWYRWLGIHDSNIWNLVMGYLMWNIWTERNWLSFENTGKSLAQLLDLCQ